MIAIKPHHFIDIITAYGDGHRHFKPHPFGHAVHTVAHQILADPEIVLVMELGADAICGPLPAQCSGPLGRHHRHISAACGTDRQAGMESDHRRALVRTPGACPG